MTTPSKAVKAVVRIFNDVFKDLSFSVNFLHQHFLKISQTHHASILGSDLVQNAQPFLKYD